MKIKFEDPKKARPIPEDLTQEVTRLDVPLSNEAIQHAVGELYRLNQEVLSRMPPLVLPYRPEPKPEKWQDPPRELFIVDNYSPPMVQLPPLDGVRGQTFTIKATNSFGCDVNIITHGAECIEGNCSLVLRAGSVVRLFAPPKTEDKYHNMNWWVLL